MLIKIYLSVNALIPAGYVPAFKCRDMATRAAISQISCLHPLQGLFVMEFKINDYPQNLIPGF